MMVSPDQAKAIINGIQNKIEACKGTRIWDDYINSLKLISQVVFTRSSGFILELIQNAEDAGLELNTKGIFQIRVNNHRVMVTHNGCPFTEEDVNALCGIRSSKKPERGTLGYLGIGFKSVFKVTDCPEVYSGGFHFKFDRNYKEWGAPSNVPWHVLPIWIDEPSEAIDSDKTAFITPFREESYYPILLEEIKNLNTQLYLFLRWLRKIEVTDEVSGQTWVLENAGESEEGITTLKQDGRQQRFKFFRRTLKDIPDWVKQDRLTQEYRANVTQREIAIAFAMDDEGNLSPVQAGAMYGGVYSFLPLGEAKSGAKFPMQADFLVQPGREAINYEASWNQWLVEQVADLCREAIKHFRRHGSWRYQYLPAFEFTKSRGLESYEKLFGPKLIEPIEKFLWEGDSVPTIDGDNAKPSEVVKLSESEEAIKDLVSMGILNRKDVPIVLGGRPSLKFVDPRVKESQSISFRSVDKEDLLSNEDFLNEKSKEPTATEWFRNLYLWLNAHRRWIGSGKSRYQEGYWYHKIILTADGNLVEGRNAWLPDFQLSDPLLKDLAELSEQSKVIVHPDILRGAKNDEEQKTLRGFLLGLTGVQLLDSTAICKETLLPKILITTEKPLPDDLVKYTTYCQQILGEDIPRGSEFWVLTKQGDVRAAKEALFPKEFHPEQDWETHQKYVPGLNFVSPSYLAGVTNQDQFRAWRQFLRAGGVKESPDNGVENFAMNYTLEKLRSACRQVTPVDKLNYGYDIEAEAKSGELMRIEVKGKTKDEDIELDRNETRAADANKDSFYLCVVSSIPENPKSYMVKDPVTVGKKDKVLIPADIWRTSPWD